MKSQVIEHLVLSSWPGRTGVGAALADIKFLEGYRYLLHARDAKFCAAFDGILKSAGIEAVRLPPRSPNLNPHLERWNRSVKEECLSKLILFPTAADRVGESSGEIQTRLFNLPRALGFGLWQERQSHHTHGSIGSSTILKPTTPTHSPS
jgi:transposase InsO family protein